MELELQLIELPILKATKRPCQATQRPDQRQLRGDDVNVGTKTRSLRKREAMLGFTLRFNKRIARREQVRVHDVAAVRRHSEVTGLRRDLERATQEITGLSDRSRPGHDETEGLQGP